jgi:hypothetical protein
MCRTEMQTFVGRTVNPHLRCACRLLLVLPLLVFSILLSTFARSRVVASLVGFRVGLGWSLVARPRRWRVQN